MDADFLRQLTVKELQALARERSIKGRSKLRKAELIKALSDTVAQARAPLLLRHLSLSRLLLRHLLRFDQKWPIRLPVSWRA